MCAETREKREMITKKWKLINLKDVKAGTRERPTRESLAERKRKKPMAIVRFTERRFRGLEMARALITVVR